MHHAGFDGNLPSPRQPPRMSRDLVITSSRDIAPRLFVHPALDTMLQKLKTMPLKGELKVGAAVALAILIGVVIFQDAEPVETRLLFVNITMPRAGLLAMTLLIGIVSGILLTLRWSAKRAKKDKR